MPRDEVLKTFGDRLKWARAQKGMTQVDLAAKTGINKDAISSWETKPLRAARIREVNLRAMATLLDVDPEWLRGGGSTPHIPSPERRTVGARRSVHGAEGKALRALETLRALRRGYQRELGDAVAAGQLPTADRLMSWFKEMDEASDLSPPASGENDGPAPQRGSGQAER